MLRVLRKARDHLASHACVDNTYRSVVKEHKSLLEKFSIRALSERFVTLLDSRPNELGTEQVPENLGESVLSAPKTLTQFITKICDFPYPT